MLLFLLTFYFPASLQVEYIPSSVTYPSLTHRPLLAYYQQKKILVSFSSLSMQDSLRCMNTFNLTTLVWTDEAIYSEIAPPVIKDSVYFISDTKFFIIGGLYKGGPSNDIWVIDLNILVWQRVEYKGEFSKVYSAGFSIDNTHNAYIFGGYTGFEVNSKLFWYKIFSFNTKTYEMTQILYTGSALGLISPMIAYESDTLYMISGYSLVRSTIFYNEALFIYHIATKSWESKSIIPLITPRISGGFIVNSTFFYFQGLHQHKIIPIISKINLTSATSYEFDSHFEIYDFSYASTGPFFFSLGGLNTDRTNTLTRFSAISLATSTLSAEFLAPSPRKFAVFTAIEDKLYLFGGVSSEGYLNDMWRFVITKNSWERIVYTGDNPSIRSNIAFTGEGSSIFLFGGIGTQYLNDLYLFHSSVNHWTMIKPLSSDGPSARSSSCMVFYKKFLFIYGGKTSHGFLSELWSFDLIKLGYTFLSNSTYTYENNKCFIQGSTIHIFSTNMSHRVLTKYDIETNTWQPEVNLGIPTLGSSDIFIMDKLIVIGGLLKDSILKSTLSIIDLGLLSTSIVDIPFSVYDSLVLHYQSYLYLLGGTQTYGNTILAETYSKIMIKFDLTQIFQGNICSKGSYFFNNTCPVCAPGSYSNTSSSFSCFLCPIGTYNKANAGTSLQQCNPCKIGKWSDSEGQSFCRDCPSNKYCPYGSTEPTFYISEPSYLSIQPSAYVQDFGEYNKYSLAAIYSSIILAFLIMSFALLFKRLRDKLHLLDIYTSKHNHTIMVPMYIKKTTFGGICTLLFFLSSSNFIMITVFKFYMANIVETRTLVPLITVSDSQTIQADLLFHIDYSYYGGNCDPSSQNIIIQPSHLTGKFIYNNYLHSSSCYIEIQCSNCSVNSGASIKLNLTEDYSFASKITVNVSSTSGVPGSVSSIQSYVMSDSLQFFVGDAPTVLQFTLTPTIVKTDGEVYSGYHVSMESESVLGSQSDSMDFFGSSGLSTEIKLLKTSTCLVISRDKAVGLLELFSVLIGTVFGLMSSVGGILNITEKHYDSLNNWAQHKGILNYYSSRISKIIRVINLDRPSLSRDTTNDNFRLSVFQKDFPDEKTDLIK